MFDILEAIEGVLMKDPMEKEQSSSLISIKLIRNNSTI